MHDPDRSTSEPAASVPDSPARPAPLSDVRILAVEQYGAGPYGSVQLADLGAEVIKIEDPRLGGDVGRYVGPFAEGEDSLFFETFNRNKRSVSLDLSTEAGREVFERLVAVSDVVYSNLRGDVPAKLRIRYDDLKHLNPQIVCVSLSGFGMNGPMATNPAYDYILQGMAGWMELTGEPDGPPTKSGLSVVDFAGGLVAVGSLLAGVHAARRDGVGMDCDLSLYDTAMSMLTYPAVWHMNAGFEPRRTRHSAHPSLVPFQAFEAQDGWMIVGCAKEKFWARLTEVIGHPEWSREGSQYHSFADRREHREELLDELGSIFAGRPVAQWLELMRSAGVPCGPVNDVAEALQGPQLEARQLVATTQHPRFGEVRQLTSPMRAGEPRAEHRRAPHRGEDLEHVAALSGLSREELDALAARGAFGELRPHAVR